MKIKVYFFFVTAHPLRIPAFGREVFCHVLFHAHPVHCKNERHVVQNVMAFLSDEANLAIIVQDVLKYFDSRTDESELKSIRKRIADIKKEADAAANAFIEAKSPLLKQRIEKRMQECEVLLADLEKVKARLLLERGQKLTEQDIVAFVKIILQGDVAGLEFRRRLIDNLVYKVYVSDDDTYIFFNIKGGNHIEEITLKDTKAALKEANRVQTQRDPLRQKEPKSNTRFRFFFFILFRFSTIAYNTFKSSMSACSRFILNV